VANRVLEMMSELCCGWLLLDGARIASEKLDALRSSTSGEDASGEKAFYEGKMLVGAYFARNILPNAKHTAEIIGREDTSAIDMPTGGFATV
jgi:hypothetical protein